MKVSISGLQNLFKFMDMNKICVEDFFPIADAQHFTLTRFFIKSKTFFVQNFCKKIRRWWDFFKDVVKLFYNDFNTAKSYSTIFQPIIHLYEYECWGEGEIVEGTL